MEEPQPSSGMTHHPAGSHKHTAAVLLTHSHFQGDPASVSLARLR